MSASEVSAAAQDYLKVIWTAKEWSTAPVTTKVLAERLGFSPSSVSEMVRRLAGAGLVRHRRYGAIELTDDGTRHALEMVRRHRLLETFLVNELGYTWDQVHDEAERMEHSISDLFVDKMDTLLGRPERDPHGDPIPAADGTLPPRRELLLSAADIGVQVVVQRISDADPEMLRFFSSVGILPGVPLEIVARRGFDGVLTLRLRDGDTPLEFGPPSTDAVWVIGVDERGTTADDQRRQRTTR